MCSSGGGDPLTAGGSGSGSGPPGPGGGGANGGDDNLKSSPANGGGGPGTPRDDDFNMSGYGNNGENVNDRVLCSAGGTFLDVPFHG